MVVVQVCVGSSCHIKGSSEIVGLLEKYVAENKLENEIVLSGSFCMGECNRIGVTVSVDDEIYAGITTENFRELWNGKIMPSVIKQR